MLLLYLVIVILLAEKFAIPLDNSIEKFGMPQEFGGAMIAALVLTPEGIGAVQATLRNQLQRSINILLGSVLATIGLTIPAVLIISLVTKRPVTLGVQGGNLPLLLLTLASECRYVYEQKDKYPAGLRSLAPFRGICVTDLCTLNCSSRSGSTGFPVPDSQGGTLHVSLHYDGVRSFLGDLKSKPFVKA